MATCMGYIGRVGSTDPPCYALSYQDACRRHAEWPPEEMKGSVLQFWWQAKQWMLLPNLNLISIFMAITMSYTAGELWKDLLFTVSHWLTSPYHSVIQTVSNFRAVWCLKSITASFPQQFGSNSHMENHWTTKFHSLCRTLSCWAFRIVWGVLFSLNDEREFFYILLTTHLVTDSC